jgi:hypothetical protein
VPAAAVGALMMGPDDIAMVTASLIIGSALRFQLRGLDQRLSPPPLSQETASTAEDSKNIATTTNINSFLNIEHPKNRLFKSIFNEPVWSD